MNGPQWTTVDKGGHHYKQNSILCLARFTHLTNIITYLLIFGLIEPSFATCTMGSYACRMATIKPLGVPSLGLSWHVCSLGLDQTKTDLETLFVKLETGRNSEPDQKISCCLPVQIHIKNIKHDRFMENISVSFCTSCHNLLPFSTNQKLEEKSSMIH